MNLNALAVSISILCTLAQSAVTCPAIILGSEAGRIHRAQSPEISPQSSDPIDRVLSQAASSIAEGIEIQVIDSSTGKAVPGAPVVVPREGTLRSRNRVVLNVPPIGGLLGRRLERAQWYRCDAAGQTKIPFEWAHQSAAFVLVRHRDRIGLATPREISRGRLVVKLRASRSLQLRVKDESGAAVAGITVAMQMRDSWTKSGSGTNLVTARTNAQGFASIPHARTIWKMIAGKSNASQLASVVTAMNDPVAKEIHSLGSSSTEIDLIVPKLKTTTVRVRGPHSAPPPPGTSVAIVSGRKDIPFRLWEGTEPVACDANGDAIIRHLGPLARYQVLASHPDFPVTCTSAHSGEKAKPLPDVIPLTWAPRDIVYFGTMVNDKGKSLQGGNVLFTFPKAGGTSIEVPLTQSGSFELRRPHFKAQSEFVLVSHPGTGKPKQAYVELPRSEEAQFDLGKVELATSRLVASGVILGINGIPLQGAKVFAQMPRKLQMGVITNRVLEPQWTMSNAGGKFELHLPSQAIPPEITIVAKHPSASEKRSHVVSPGATDLILSMQDTGPLQVTVKLPEAFSSESQLAVSLNPSNPDALPNQRLAKAKRRVRGNTLYLDWPKLPVAAYDLRVGIRMSKFSSQMSKNEGGARSGKMSLHYDAKLGVVTLSNIRVFARGRRKAPLPFLHMDLIVRTTQLTVEDSSGAPLNHYFLSMQPDDALLANGLVVGERTRALLLPRDLSTVHATVSSRGFHNANIDIQRAAHTVTMRREVTASIVVSNVPARASGVSLALRQEGMEVMSIRLPDPIPGSSWSATAHGLWAGTFEVIATVSSSTQAAKPQKFVKALGTITLAETTTIPEVSLQW